jgi:hypothetical protein
MTITTTSTNPTKSPRDFFFFFRFFFFSAFFKIPFRGVAVPFFLYIFFTPSPAKENARQKRHCRQWLCQRVGDRDVLSPVQEPAVLPGQLRPAMHLCPHAPAGADWRHQELHLLRRYFRPVHHGETQRVHVEMPRRVPVLRGLLLPVTRSEWEPCVSTQNRAYSNNQKKPRADRSFFSPFPFSFFST